MRISVFVGIAVAALAVNKATCHPLSTAAEVQTALAGNTITGEENGEPFVEYLDPKGQILGENKQGRYKGQWRIENAKICFHYDDDAAQYWDCVSIDIEANKIIWTDEDGEKTAAKLMPGKPGGW